MRAAAAAILASVVGLLLKKHNPETALMIGAATAAVLIGAALGILNGFGELRRLSGQMIGKDSGLFLSPVLKCLAISIITKFSAEICKDASQNAAAAAVDFLGSVCALSVVMPLLLSVLQTIGGTQ